MPLDDAPLLDDPPTLSRKRVAERIIQRNDGFGDKHHPRPEGAQPRPTPDAGDILGQLR